MKPAPEVAALDALIARHEAVVVELRRARLAVVGVLGSDQPTPERQVRVGRGADRRGRATVRRKAAKAAKALRTPSGRRRAVAGGSLAARIVEILAEQKAPMKSAALVVAANADAKAVMFQAKRLVDDGQIVKQGKSRATTYAVPKFANVIVAED